MRQLNNDGEKCSKVISLVGSILQLYLKVSEDLQILWVHGDSDVGRGLCFISLKPRVLKRACQLALQGLCFKFPISELSKVNTEWLYSLAAIASVHQLVYTDDWYSPSRAGPQQGTNITSVHQEFHVNRALIYVLLQLPGVHARHKTLYIFGCQISQVYLANIHKYY